MRVVLPRKATKPPDQLPFLVGELDPRLVAGQMEKFIGRQTVGLGDLRHRHVGGNERLAGMAVDSLLYFVQA